MNRSLIHSLMLSTALGFSSCSGGEADFPVPVSATYLEKVADGVTLKMFVFDEDDCEIAVFANQTRDDAQNLSEWAQKTKALAACNGGYFDPGPFVPSGLEISGGNSTGKLTAGDSYVGNLVVNASSARLVWDSEPLVLTEMKQFLQCSPWLVSEGKTYNPAASSEGEPKAFRTFIMTNGQGRWCIGKSSSVTLSGLAQILASPDLIPGFTVNRALNLDGGPSTGLWVRGREQQLKNDQPKWKVRNGILVRARR